MLSIFEREDDFAGEPRIDLVNPVNIDQGGAVDAQELCRIEMAFEIGDGLVDAVAAAVDDGVGELVVGEEVGDVVERKERDAFADAGSDAAWDSSRDLHEAMR